MLGHAAVEYFLINIGTIQMSCGSASAPSLQVYSDLYYGDMLSFSDDYFDEDRISLMRDLRERRILAELVAGVGQALATVAQVEL